mgnify:CR=1 FL=1
MKIKILKYSFITAILGIALWSCKKDEKIKVLGNELHPDQMIVETSIQNIFEDPLLLEIETNIIHLNPVSNISEILQELSSKTVLIQDDIDNVSEALGFPDPSGLNNFLLMQDSLYQILIYKYNLTSYSPSELTHCLNDVIISLPAPNNCDTHLRVCAIEASADAALMHLGCGALDLTVLGGIMCHGVVAGWHYNALQGCNLDWDDCMNS